MSEISIELNQQLFDTTEKYYTVCFSNAEFIAGKLLWIAIDSSLHLAPELKHLLDYKYLIVTLLLLIEFRTKTNKSATPWVGICPLQDVHLF